MTQPDPRRPMVEPFRLLLAAVCVLYAVLALSDFDRYGSPAIKALDHRSQAIAFLVGLLVSGGWTVVGTVCRWPRWEAAGLLALSGVWGCFAWLGALNSGSRSAAFSSFLIAFSLAALWVVVQVFVFPWWRARRARRGA